jgi:hypothetical protein
LSIKWLYSHHSEFKQIKKEKENEFKRKESTVGPGNLRLGSTATTCQCRWLFAKPPAIIRRKLKRGLLFLL